MANSNPYCQTHKVEMTYKQGVSKAGKDYEGYFCPEKNEDRTNCQSVQWVNKKPYKKPQPLLDDQQYTSIMEALRKIYALVESKK